MNTGCYRERSSKEGAARRAVRRSQIASVRPKDASRNGEPKSSPARLRVPGCITTEERVEEV